MERVDQTGFKLPTGPILMSPDFLIDSAKREILFRNPEVYFKFCLVRFLFKTIEIKNSPLKRPPKIIEG